MLRLDDNKPPRKEKKMRLRSQKTVAVCPETPRRSRRRSNGKRSRSRLSGSEIESPLQSKVIYCLSGYFSMVIVLLLMLVEQVNIMVEYRAGC